MKHKYEEATDVEIEYLEAWDREDPMPNIKKTIEAIIKVIADKRLDHYESLLPVKEEKVATKTVKI